METTSLIKVALADDHVLVRAGLTQIINKHEDMEVMVEASHGKELLDLLESKPVDVVLLDLDMPVMDGKTTLEHICRDFSEIRVIILSVHHHDSFIVHMMEAGAHGYLLKESEPEEVIKAIRTVMSDGLYFNDKVSRALLGGVSKSKSPHSPLIGESLNERELEVLVLICNEKTTQQIADELFLSPKTIEGYRKSLLQKTGTKNAAGIAIYAMKNGLI
jgi:DNA-binding NarL/FixJ family response regulator